MSEPYLGEIRIFAGNYAPQGWAFCNGQILSISEYDALFALIGTTYGGDGQTTFALPDLQCRIPIQANVNYPLSAKDGTETVTLVSNQLPAHTHVPNAASADGTASSPGGAVWATAPTLDYSDGSGIQPQAMSMLNILPAGGSMPHDNMMPSLATSFIIALVGIFPQQS